MGGEVDKSINTNSGKMQEAASNVFKKKVQDEVQGALARQNLEYNAKLQDLDKKQKDALQSDLAENDKEWVDFHRKIKEMQLSGHSYESLISGLQACMNMCLHTMHVVNNRPGLMRHLKDKMMLTIFALATKPTSEAKLAEQIQASMTTNIPLKYSLNVDDTGRLSLPIELPGGQNPPRDVSLLMNALSGAWLRDKGYDVDVNDDGIQTVTKGGKPLSSDELNKLLMDKSLDDDMKRLFADTKLSPERIPFETLEEQASVGFRP